MNKITIDREVLKEVMLFLEQRERELAYTGGKRGPVFDNALKILQEALAQPCKYGNETHHYRDQAEQTLKIKQLESRWKQANRLSMSYMGEFEKRGLVYTPLLPVDISTFK